MDATWSNFLFQTPPPQAPTDGTIQSDLLPELTGSAHSPPLEHVEETPPSTVDTAALSEDPAPVKPLVSRSSSSSSSGRVQHSCSICSKTFRNGYNLRRHQAVHSGIRMKDRAARGVTGVKGQVPLSLLQLSPAPQTPLTDTQAETPAGAMTTATTVTTQTLTTAVVVAGTMVQVSQGALLSPVPVVACAVPVRKNHACEACGKAFRDVYHLNRHRLSHSDEKPFSCPICQQRFKRKDRMSYHVRSHQGGIEKPYVCPHCAKGFSRPDHLNSHVRQVHSTERPFKCPTCQSAFATKDRLRAHLIRHEDKVPCHVCGKLLSPAYITDHMRVHNQSQHHVCHLCNRSFTTLTYLRVHAQKHHGGEWKEGGGGRGVGGVLLCQLCGVRCKTPTQLQGHMGTHTHADTDTHTHTSSHADTHTHTHTHTHTATHADTHTHTHTATHADTHTHTHTATHADTHTHTHMGAHAAHDPAHDSSHSTQSPTHTMSSDAPATPTSTSITVTAGDTTVSLLVTDCSSITPQSHS
ncbi:vascular endothelial zinc finger 1-like isoform X2 [Alosa pseudoharengus]|uniref:vascular endothelial zinc finger 1-like isoform X2 n=1 Tax=Alosa pseudoharengus TaxID=34774 RepID=UPI003F8AFA41